MSIDDRPIYDRKLTPLYSGATHFGFYDKKAAFVGYSWQVFTAVYTPVKEGALSGYILRDGLPREHIMIAANPTRDGKSYGAWTGYLHCLSKAEAEKLIDKRIAQARKRDTKKFGVV